MNKQKIQTIAHRTCRKYKHNSPIPTDLTKAEYTFDEDTLIDFVEKILRQSDYFVTTDNTKLEGEIPSSAPKLKEKE